MNGKKGMLMIWIIAAIVIVAGIFIYTTFGKSSKESNNFSGLTNSNSNTAPSTSSANNGANTGSSPVPVTRTVMITDSGFSPQSLTINRGDTVKWLNDGSSPSWPASAMHPTHRVYPGSDIEKCGTNEEEGIFDACTGIEPGQSWSFTFNEVGTWRYHDHLHAQLYGTIVVQ